ncbi:tetratricopeptide repeat protein [Rheinheimera maricola]|uniref:Tetratricopeptide repeat protein n=1 Tax=Rheinheimera maricola TaxID=2793282 RepID=A0ABS7X7H6_9GAMM|nr:tetratricopeptide repeat protein [Rheinheimera maricola]MBZ9611070.1 tetratricopeptide repeat protein [Rheinheimera maricola]
MPFMQKLRLRFKYGPELLKLQQQVDQLQADKAGDAALEPVLAKLAERYIDFNFKAEGLALLPEVVRLQQKLFGQYSEQLLATYEQYCFAYDGDKKVIPYYRLVLQQLQHLRDTKHDEAATLYELAELYEDWDLLADAEHYLQQSLEVAKSCVVKDDEDLSSYVYFLADFYGRHQRHDDATATVNLYLLHIGRNGPPSRFAYSAYLRVLAGVYENKGDLLKQQQLIKKADSIIDDSFVAVDMHSPTDSVISVDKASLRKPAMLLFVIAAVIIAGLPFI